MSTVCEIEPQAPVCASPRFARTHSAVYTAEQLADLLQVCTRQIWP